MKYVALATPEALAGAGVGTSTGAGVVVAVALRLRGRSVAPLGGAARADADADADADAVAFDAVVVVGTRCTVGGKPKKNKQTNEIQRQRIDSMTLRLELAFSK